MGEVRLKILAVAPTQGFELGPGELRTGDGLIAGTGNGAVALLEVQPAGKRRMTGDEFVRGLREVSGMSLT